MDTSEDHQFADRIERLSLHEMKRDAWRRCQQPAGGHYEGYEAGLNTNMTNFPAALGTFG